jgi:hypothetical protein
MHFNTKNYLKNTHNHTAKYALSIQKSYHSEDAVNSLSLSLQMIYLLYHKDNMDFAIGSDNIVKSGFEYQY